MKNFLTFFFLSWISFFQLQGQCVISENFDSYGNNAFPTDWFLINTVGGTSSVLTQTTTSPAPPSAPRFIRLNAGTGGNLANQMIFISPRTASLSSGTNRVRFFTRGTTAPTNVLIVGTIDTTVSSGTFTPIATIGNMTTTAYNEFIVNIPAGTNKYLAFKHGLGANSQFIELDNICVQPIPSCLEVTNIVPSNATTTSIDIAWNESGSGENDWQYSVQPVGTGVPVVDGTPFTSMSATPSTTASGLTANTDYEIYIRSNCGGGDYGAWIKSSTNLRTLCDPGAMNYCENFTSYANNSIPFCWQAVFTTSSSGGVYVSLENAPYSKNMLELYYTSACTGPMMGISPDVTYAMDGLHRLRIKAGATDATANLLLIGSVDDNGIFTLITTLTLSTNRNTEYLINLPLTGNKRYAFKHAGTFNKYVWINEVCIENIPSCQEVTNIAANNVTSATANLIWNISLTGESNWEYLVLNAGSTAPTSGTSGTASSSNIINPIVVLPNTSYDVYVRAACGGGDFGAWVGPYTFLTPCAPLMAGFSDDFETQTANQPLKPCWSIYDVDAGSAAIVGSVTAFGVAPSQGTLMVRTTYFNTTTANGVVLVTPNFSDLDANKQIRFKINRRLQASDNAVFKYKVGTVNSPSDIASFQLLDDTSMTQLNVIPNTWKEITIKTSNYNVGAGHKYLAFVVEFVSGTTAQYLFMDEFFYEEIPGPLCIAPGTISSKNITDNSATINWVAPSPAPVNGYQYVIQAAGTSNPDMGTPVASAVNSVSLTNLTDDFAYEFYVRAVCSADQSAWTGPYAFNTLPFVCQLPTSLFISNITTSSASLSWNGIVPAPTNGYEYIVQLSGTGNPGSASGTPTASTSATLGGLNDDTAYEAYVRSICSDDESAWAGPVTFTTQLFVCAVPSNVTISNVTFNAAQINWTAAVPAPGNGYEYIVQAAGTGNPGNVNGTPAANSPVMLSSLNEETAYEVYVKSICGVDSSLWVGPANFMTTAEVCNAPTGIMISNISGPSATISWTSPMPAPVNGFEYIIQLAGTGNPGNGDAMTTLTNMATTIDLYSNTSYEVYVRSLCQNNQSDWAGPVTFTSATFINDEPETAYPVGISATYACESAATGNFIGATRSDEYPCTATIYQNHKDLWFTFIAAETATYVLSSTSTNGGTNPYMALWTGAPGNLTQIPGGCVTQFTMLSATQGTRYYVSIASDVPTREYSLCIYRLENAPANDLIANAFTLTQSPNDECANGIQGTLSNATHSVDNICLTTADVWYKFTPTQTAEYTLRRYFLNGSSPTGIRLYSGTPGNLTPVTIINTDPASQCGGNQIILVNLIAGQQYYACVSTTPSSVPVYFTLCAYPSPAAPVNNACANATPLTVGVTFEEFEQIGDNTSANALVADAPVPSCGFFPSFLTIGRDVWYTVVVPPTGKVTILTRGVDGSLLLDNYMQVYTGNCASLLPYFNQLGETCNDEFDFTLPGAGSYAGITFTGATPGTLLKVRVWGWFYQFGEFKISAYDDTPPLVCNAPVNITVPSVTSSTATISWTAAMPTPINGYQYYLSTNNTPPNNATAPTGISPTTTLNLNGLTASTTYYIYIRSNCGQTGPSEWTSATIFMTPGTSGCAVTINSDNQAICTGENVTLSITGTWTTIQWYGPSGLIQGANLPTLTLNNVQGVQSGIYSVQVTNASECTTSASYTILVNALPLAGATATPNAICAGETLILGANGGVSYNWSGPGAFTSTLQNPAIANSNASNAGVYNVTVTNQAGCTASTSVNVVVNPVPVGTISANTTSICVGNTLQLSSNGGTSYLWIGPLGYTSTQQNPSLLITTYQQAGKYRVSVSNAVGCSVEYQIEIGVSYPPIAILTYEQSSACVGSDLQLHGLGAGTYAWSGPGGWISEKQDPIIEGVTGAQSGIYILNVTSPNGCIATTSVNITINVPPVFTANPQFTQTCEGSTVALSATGTGDYAWSGPYGWESNLQNPIIENIPYYLSGTYTVELTAQNGCISSREVEIEVFNQVNVKAWAEENPVCQGSSLQLHAEGGISYLWTGPAGFQSKEANPRIDNINSAQAGVYYVYVYNEGGCFSYAKVNVEVIQVEKAVAFANPNPVTEFGFVQFFASEGISFVWTGPGGFTSTEQNPFIKRVDRKMAGVYEVTIYDEKGCPSTAKVVLRVLYTNKGQNGLSFGDDNSALSLRSETTGSVFPNPVSSDLYFSLEDGVGVDYILYDMNGQVRQSVLTISQNHISTENLANGFYIIMWKPKGETEWIKDRFVKIGN